MKPVPSLSGAGLGLRREHLQSLAREVPSSVQFLEVAPENWIKAPKQRRQLLEQILDQTPLVCHGLSLSLGSPTPLDMNLLHDIRTFLQTHQVVRYTEHLSYCSDQGHLYDLMPIPFTKAAAHYVADRIKQTQDFLGESVAVENVSYYCAPGQQMPEIEFIHRVLELADCELLLDINNIFVNSVNHGYDADSFLRQLPTERISYGHIAGHYVEQPDLIIDSHGAPVRDDVWQLLGKAYQYHGVFPTLLERDFNIPTLDKLVEELDSIHRIQHSVMHQQKEYACG
ncbi:DUF692 domain-containing protein [Thalassotalea sp. G20_0]|uniref:HvfB family MNIO-type RiPP peptide maturase n=1 Tax=Thalassotalea sp. G20_0 TaxID=2821093 RepID=UPI001ADA8E9D|nr:DUF692 domain-containing protein [Thalassotalea sp. G20_0]MBO9493114.1 DUF692 domain-containing protein [Thalassotalea sp. G20_0]